MSVYATRKFRNAAALLMLIAGVLQVALLWFRETSPLNLGIALAGMFYLLLALGLSGRSRFTLWLTTASVMLAAAARSTLWIPTTPDPVLAMLMTIDGAVALLCLYILFRTRYADMD